MRLDNKEKVLSKLKEKENEGFEYGEVKSFIKNLASEHNLSISTIRNMYYTKVKKDNVDKEGNTKEKKDNLSEIHNINGKTVRVIKEDENRYYVGKDLFSSIGLNRMSPIAKKGLQNHHMHYIKVKSSHGFATTLVIPITGVREFLKFVLDNHNNSKIKGNCLNFLNHLDKNYYADNNIEDNHKVEPTSKLSTTKAVKPLSLEKEDNLKDKLTKTPTMAENKKTAENQLKGKKINTFVDQEKKYRFGEVVPVRITRIETFGPLVETMDGLETRGLIHISDIKNGWVSDPAMYFSIGQELEVKVKSYNQKEDKLSLTTKHLNLKLITDENNTEVKVFTNPPINTMGEKLRNLKTSFSNENSISFDTNKQIDSKEEATEFNNNLIDKNIVIDKDMNTIIKDNDNAQLELENLTKLASSQNESKEEEEFLELKIAGSRELQEIILYLKKYVGALSPSAKEKLLEVINENNIVSFTMAMVQVAPEFKVDPSLRLVNEISKQINKVNGGL